MIDPMLSLVFSVYSNIGAYALLLGSGVSRSAGIPTGWEVVLDLIRKLASIEGDDCEPDPEIWFSEKYGKYPDYSILLESLAKSPAERNRLLRSYFEPDQEEREQGIKQPTEAHNAIAELVANGYIRVIVTTNFDRLIEDALEAAGVTPTVISTSDTVEGALPLIHTQCSVIKVHGDYLDTRIKNTPEELETYDERMNGLLDQVFDEFGLIVCGWSAEWDLALRRAIQRCKSHRFTTYWTSRGNLGKKAEELANLRRAQVVSIGGANAFFRDLTDKVIALAEYSQPHPLSSKLAVAQLKRYLVDERHRIQLRDMVNEETEKLFSELTDEKFPVQGNSFNNNDEFSSALHDRVKRYEALASVLLAIFTTGCYWDDSRYQDVWVNALERIANPEGSNSGTLAWINLRSYPGLFLLYGGGIAALAAERYDTFRALLVDVNIRESGNRDKKPLVLSLYPESVLRKDLAQLLPGMERHYVPLSDYLFDVLRDPLRELLPQDSLYQETFDRFEYLSSLVYIDIGQGDEITRFWAPIGCFGWRGRHSYPIGTIMGEVDVEVENSGIDWPVLKAGLFRGSVDRFRAVKDGFDKMVLALPWI